MKFDWNEIYHMTKAALDCAVDIFNEKVSWCRRVDVIAQYFNEYKQRVESIFGIATDIIMYNYVANMPSPGSEIWYLFGYKLYVEFDDPGQQVVCRFVSKLDGKETWISGGSYNTDMCGILCDIFQLVKADLIGFASEAINDLGKYLENVGGNHYANN